MSDVQPQGRDLRQQRINAHVTQTDLAAALGIPRPTLSQIENEHLPLDEPFAARYRKALRALAREKAGSAA